MQSCGSPLQVLVVFLRLGCGSFGGPVAHIGYFRREFVERRRWLGEREFADLLALCQFLPGPASSQLGFSIGLKRSGYRGALAAWAGFTLPSAVAMLIFAHESARLSGPLGNGLIHGLKLAAVPIVTQAVVGMGRVFCADVRRAAIALAAAILASILHSGAGQIAALALAGACGAFVCREAVDITESRFESRVSRRVAYTSLATFVLLFAGLPFVSRSGLWPGASELAAFYRAGALVFGGGHVVLPLLHDAFVTSGWMSDEVFLAGYGAAQAIPGPLFCFAAYLGALANPVPNGIAGAAAGLVGIFLPGMLLVTGVLPFWQSLRNNSAARAMMSGINSAVVGLLAAALYDPVIRSSVHSPADWGLALAGCAALMLWRAPPWLMVVLFAVAGIVSFL